MDDVYLQLAVIEIEGVVDGFSARRQVGHQFSTGPQPELDAAPDIHRNLRQACNRIAAELTQPIFDFLRGPVKCASPPTACLRSACDRFGSTLD